MRRIIFLLIIAGIVLCFSIGCQDVESPVTESQGAETVNTRARNEVLSLRASAPLLVDYSDSILEAGYNREYQLVDENRAFQPQTTLTIKFNGEEYEGEYAYMLPSGYGCSYTVYKYVAVKDGKRFLFYVREDGTLNEFDFASYELDKSSKKLSREQCLSIATAFLKEKVDLSGFESTESNLFSKDNGYCFGYIRHISGIKTVEKVVIKVSYDGTIINYYEAVEEKINSCPDLSDIQWEELQRAVYQKLDPIALAIQKEYEVIEYQEPKYVLTVLKEGNLALLCEVTVHAKKQIAEDVWEHGGEVFLFVIPLVEEITS